MTENATNLAKRKVPKVVHCMREPYDVYVGRGRCPKTHQWGKWGNPYSHKPSVIARYLVGTVEEAIARYRADVERNPQLIAQIKRELKGKTLGCWCKPGPCHGDVLLEIANG